MKLNVLGYTISIQKREPVKADLRPNRIHVLQRTLSSISSELFPTALVTYIILLIMETMKEDFVSYFINPNIILFIVIVSGIIRIACSNEEYIHTTIREKFKWKYVAFISFTALLLVYYKTEELQGLSIVLTILTGGIIFLLSYVMNIDKESF